MSSLKIQPIAGEFGCFFVPSKSQPNYPHRVELDSFKFNGECDCERFKFGCAPMLSRGADPADHLRCSHIKAARSYFLDEVLPKFFAQMQQITKQKTTIIMEAQGLASAIVAADPGEYPDQQKIADLMELRSHVDACIEQIQHDVESARDPEKHEDAPPYDPADPDCQPQ